MKKIFVVTVAVLLVGVIGSVLGQKNRARQTVFVGETVHETGLFDFETDMKRISSKIHGQTTSPIPFSLKVPDYYEIYKDNPEYWDNILPGKIIIKYIDDIDIVLKAEHVRNIETVAKTNIQVHNRLRVTLKDTSVLTAKEFIKEIKQDKDVEFAEPVMVYKTQWIPNDPYLSEQWGIFAISAPYAWDLQKGSHSVKIAVIDQGTDYTHPDLSDAFGSLKGYDFVDNDLDPYPTGSQEKHGTHVTGIIGATMNNSIGIAGTADIELYSVRAGSLLLPYTVEGIYWVADNGMQIANMSFGGKFPSSGEEIACNYAYNEGVLLIAASGNDTTDSIGYPARFGSVIAVGAVDTFLTRADFSNYGDSLELMAPGVKILSTIPNNNYDSWNGTSMAAPFVSGIAGLVLSDNNQLTNGQVRQILRFAATSIGSTHYYGYGFVNAWKTVIFSGNYELLSPSTFTEPYIYFDEDYQMYYEASKVIPSQPAELKQIVIMFKNGSSSNEQKDIAVLAWDNNTGVPGGELYRGDFSISLKANTNEQIGFAVSPAIHVNEHFWIGHYEKSKGFPTSLVDTIPSPGVNFYSQDGVSWTEDNYDYIQLAVVKYATGISEILPKRSSLSFGIKRIAPNPVKNVLKIDFVLTEGPVDAKFSMYDTAGRLVNTTCLNNYEAGFHTHTMELSKLPAGIYFLNLRDNVNRSCNSIKIAKFN